MASKIAKPSLLRNVAVSKVFWDRGREEIMIKGGDIETEIGIVGTG